MNRVSAPQYDLFKLVVTIILVVILLLMLLRGCAVNTVAGGLAETPRPNPTEAASALPSTTEAIVSSTAIETSTQPPAPAIPTPTATITEVPPTQDSSAATPTKAAGASEPTATAEATATSADQTTPVAQDSDCNTSVPSRLAVGETARVVQRLNLRNDASITAPILQTNATGTQVEIIGGPVCTPVGERAYLWWQIRLADGTEGWSAEAQLNESSYLLEPAS